MHEQVNILKLNQNFPSVIIDERADIIEVNEVFQKQFPDENNLYNIFDKNTALLVKNSFIDVKAFTKVQRRNVQLEIDNNTNDAELIISPFKIEKKTYYFVLLFWHSVNEYLVLYPTIDDNSFKRKYNSILNRLDDSLPQTLIEKKNFQYELDIEKEPIFIKANDKYLFVNNSFAEFTRLTADEIKSKKDEELFENNLAQKLKIAEDICYLTKNIIVIESTDYSPNDLQQKNRIVKFPIMDFDNDVIATINFGSIEPKRNEEKIIKNIPNHETSRKETITESVPEDKNNVLKAVDVAVITYNPNNFKIVEANKKAMELYGYSTDELLKMDITDLCSPDDMQKLLTIQESNEEAVEFKHIKKDGSIIEVEVTTKLSELNNEKVNTSFIRLKTKQTEVKPELTKEPDTEIEERSNEKKEEIVEKDISAKQIVEEETEKKITTKPETKQVKETSPFLSSLFHEILTPVNVILGFVQEIIDSIDKPTEEQEESAKIIKDNQQLLLQTMNTAVQYSQLVENKLPMRNEEFVLNNYLLDLKDSISRVAEKENTEVNFEHLEEEITLKNDRQKLLATVSYFLKFATKLTNSEKISLSIFTENERVYFVINDSEKNISQKLIDDLTEIFNTENPFDKKNFGISPITIRLSKKLNEVTSAKVEKKRFNNNKTLAISFPVSIEQKIEEEIKEEVEQEEQTIQTPFEKDEIKSKEKIVKEEKEQIEEKVSHEITAPIIEEKIINDIEQEEEITNEEIVTKEVIIEEVIEEDKVSELSCLLIEDSVDSQLLFQTQMKDFKLLKVASGLTEALPLIKKYKFDLIYVDINLKGQYNGLDSLRIIRQFNNYDKTPIIAITAYPFEGDKEKFLKAGFTDYFRKPLLRENLISSINALFN
jgi:PAS domain S-box-containing protein